MKISNVECGRESSGAHAMNHSAASHCQRRFQPIFGRIRTWRVFRDEGQSLVEFALVLPMMLTAITGILIFGIFEMQVLSLTEGVDSAGRVLSVSAGQTLDPCAAAVTAVKQAAVAVNPNNLSYTVTMNPIAGNLAANNHQYANQTTCSSASTTTGAPGYLVSGGTVTVSVTFNACSLNFFNNRFSAGGCSISQAITEVVQ